MKKRFIYIIAIKKIRLKVLNRFWNEKLTQLIQNRNKSKKKGLVVLKRLMNINDEIKNKIIMSYYNDTKRKHIELIKEWIDTNKKLKRTSKIPMWRSTKSLINDQKNLKKKNLKRLKTINSMRNIKQNKIHYNENKESSKLKFVFKRKPPPFYYYPSDEVMIGLINMAAGNN